MPYGGLTCEIYGEDVANGSELLLQQLHKRGMFRGAGVFSRGYRRERETHDAVGFEPFDGLLLILHQTHFHPLDRHAPGDHPVLDDAACNRAAVVPDQYHVTRTVFMTLLDDARCLGHGLRQCASSGVRRFEFFATAKKSCFRVTAVLTSCDCRTCCSHFFPEKGNNYPVVDKQ